MAIMRINKTNNYTVMSNYHLKEKNMSLKAKGLLSLMLSLPDNWDYSVAGLVSICKENRTAIQTTLKELEGFGYLKRMRCQDEQGKFYYVYDVYEKPQTENLFTDNRCTENQPQLNTNELSTVSKKVSKKAQEKTDNQTFNELIEEYTDNEELQTELKEHLKTRKAKKGALTNHAIELSFKTLDKLTDDVHEKISIVQQSIENGWTSFFPLSSRQQKENKKSNYNIEEYENYSIFDSVKLSPNTA